ncbi:hypothetical protein [Mucilaginibacter celer]|uniref:Uncharacterized protein n=1 Tax=Mucilaginibacter celer TaxID=2305508 RepID=A0A494VTF6_9SPHI|nr:hypothetical protein [Mucilaginibacter celer]AYL96700.1 hypothetical protein HYN43_015950 [Mucilaginibacter celer]
MFPVKSVLICICIIINAFTNGGYQTPASNVDNKPNYSEFKKGVEHTKSVLIRHPANDIRNYLFKLIDDDIYNYWAGTPWNFYGATRQPKTGNIACGYFVTNTLSDLGFKINRIDLAEAASAKMIKKLCVEIKSFTTIDKLNSYLAKQPINSIFIIGLDFHTGYIIKTATNTYFFHSYYKKNEGVIKEKTDTSRALNASKFFMIGSLTANTGLLRKWVANKPVM